MLCFVTGHGGDVVHIQLDLAGIERLEGVLLSLRRSLERGQHDHDHLMTPAWGGNELDECASLGEADYTQAHHVIISAWE